MKQRILSLMTIILVTLVLVACSPGAVPVATPMATPTLAPQPAPAASALNPEDVAWARVVAAAKKEGEVNVYAYSWLGDIGLAIAKGFKQKYGISAIITTGRGAEIAERLKTEKRVGQRVGDMTEGSSILIGSMKVEGLLASVADELPSLKEKGVWMVLPSEIDPKDKMNLAFRLIAYTPYINNKLVKLEEKPGSWKDFLDPKWKGKMLITEPNLAPNFYETMVVFLENKIWDGNYIKALYGQNLQIATGMPELFTRLAQGEFPLAIQGTDVTGARFAMEGAPFQAIDMREGIVLSTASVAAIAGGPNPNATRLFLNWVYSQEGLSLAGKALGNKMVRKDIPDFRPKGVQTDIVKPLVGRPEQLEKSTQLFREKWFDKLVGR